MWRADLDSALSMGSYLRGKGERELKRKPESEKSPLTSSQCGVASGVLFSAHLPSSTMGWKEPGS